MFAQNILEDHPDNFISKALNIEITREIMGAEYVPGTIGKCSVNITGKKPIKGFDPANWSVDLRTAINRLLAIITDHSDKIPFKFFEAIISLITVKNKTTLERARNLLRACRLLERVLGKTYWSKYVNTKKGIKDET